MLYSLHDKVNGGFRYLEAPGSVPVNDDQPPPTFSVETPLGVPSIFAGRPVPSRSKPAGKGPQAKGSIVSPSARQYETRSSSVLPSGLSGVDSVCPHWQRLTSRGECVDKWWAGPPIEWLGNSIAFAVGGALVGYLLYRTFGDGDED